MEPFYSIDSFDAFRTDDGIEIREKKDAAKKFSLVILVVGLVFFAIGLIPMEGVTYDWITTMFSAVFFYGGILLFALGLLVLILKGMGNKDGLVTTLNKHTKIMTLRNKEIPFSEIGPIEAQTNEVMKRKLTALLFTQNGKKRGFISGTVFTEDVESLQEFLDEINTMVAETGSETES
jgi:hypothetical protein